MAAPWLPDNGEFFISAAGLIKNAKRQLSPASYDTSKFLLQRHIHGARVSSFVSLSKNIFDCLVDF